MRKATQAEIDNLVSLYLGARERLLHTITTYHGVGTKTYANTILQQLQRELNSLQKQSTTFIQSSIAAEYRQALRNTYNYFRRTRLRMNHPSVFASLHTDALYELSREMQYQISDGLAQVGRQIVRYVDTAQDEALRAAGLYQSGIKMASGGTVQDMRRSLIDQLQSSGFMTVQYGEGRNARQVPVDAYAGMVARSTSREAGNTARINQLAADGYDLVKMSEHYPTCDACAARQGRVYSISGKDRRFPPLSTAFGAYNNVHPNCRHIVSPWIESLQTPEEIRKAIELSNQPFEDTRSADEVALYNEQQNKGRQARNALYQYERYKAVLGDDAPKTYMSFAKIKKTGGSKWQALQNKYRTSLTGDEKHALNSYISSESYRINEKLRSGSLENDTDKHFVKNLDSAIGKLPKYEGVVNRSVYDVDDGYKDLIHTLAVEEDVRFPAYTSSSKEIYDDADDMRLIIHSKSGRDLAGYNDGEKEVLFARGTLFKIKKRWYDNGKPCFELEEI